MKGRFYLRKEGFSKHLSCKQEVAGSGPVLVAFCRFI